MNSVVLIALFSSTVLSLLVTIALVLGILLKRMDSTTAPDEESFKVLAVKESRERGLMSPNAQRCMPPKDYVNVVRQDEVQQQPQKQNSDVADYKMKKHKDILKWRENHERIFSDTTCTKMPNSTEVPPPLPQMKSPPSPLPQMKPQPQPQPHARPHPPSADKR